MGSAKARRLLRQESKWVDNSQPRHKHRYCNEVIVCLHTASGYEKFYTATKCNRCSSFINARFIPDYNEQCQVQQINLCSPHKWIIGFADAYLNK